MKQKNPNEKAGFAAFRSLLPAGLLLLGACATTAPTGSGASAGPAPGGTVSAGKAGYYARAFPAAKDYEVREIPSQLIRSANQGNTTYVAAKNSSGEIIGYLRDLIVPISLDDRCACDPLNITLAFNADYTFKTLIAPENPHTYGGIPMTPEEMNRLQQILRDPSQKILEAKHAEDLVDATTGATRAAYDGVVVPKAALGTHRMVGLVRDTTKILQGAPAIADRKELENAMRGAGTMSARAKALAKFLPRAQSAEFATYAYSLMREAYVQAVSGGSPAIATVERALLDGGGQAIDATEVGKSCYAMAETPRSQWVKGCVSHLRTVPGVDKLGGGYMDALEGTVAFAEGNYEAAVDSLTMAAVSFDINADPMLHLRLTRALAKAGKEKKACNRAKRLFAIHPLLPGALDTLSACPTEKTEVASSIRATQKQALIATKLNNSTAAPSIDVETDDLQAKNLTFQSSGKVTVAVFFATWCPHCQQEMPRIVEFVGAAQRDPALSGKVDVVGIRTAVERETEPYAEFQRRYRPNFPIYTDPVMALSFTKFAKALGRSPSLPTVAIIDAEGIVRYVMPGGHYRDTKRELTWAVESLF